MEIGDKVKTPRANGYIIEIKIDKAKVQLTDAGGHRTKEDWFSIKELEQTLN